MPALLERHDLGVAAEQDIRAAPRHVGRDRNRALASSLGNDLGLALMLLGVQDSVLDTDLLQLLREHLRRRDRNRADEDGLARSRGAP